MPNYIRYDFPHQDILYRQFNGDVSISDLVNSWKEIFDLGMNKKLPDKFISDFRNCNIQIHPNEIEQFVAFLEIYKEKTENIKMAVLVDTPKSIALTGFAIKKLKSKGIIEHIKEFSTEESLICWIEDFQQCYSEAS